MKIRKGDQVKIISGNDKGKKGKVLAVFPKIGKIAIEGINMKKKHMKPRSQGQKGQLVRIPAPFSASRTAVICPSCGITTRVAFKLVEKRKYRVCRKCGGEI